MAVALQMPLSMGSGATENLDTRLRPVQRQSLKRRGGATVPSSNVQSDVDSLSSVKHDFCAGGIETKKTRNRSDGHVTNTGDEPLTKKPCCSQLQTLFDDNLDFSPHQVSPTSVLDTGGDYSLDRGCHRDDYSSASSTRLSESPAALKPAAPAVTTASYLPLPFLLRGVNSSSRLLSPDATMLLLHFGMDTRSPSSVRLSRPIDGDCGDVTGRGSVKWEGMVKHRLPSPVKTMELFGISLRVPHDLIESFPQTLFVASLRPAEAFDLKGASEQIFADGSFVGTTSEHAATARKMEEMQMMVEIQLQDCTLWLQPRKDGAGRLQCHCFARRTT